MKRLGALLAASFVAACSALGWLGGDKATVAIVGATVIHPESDAAPATPNTTILIAGNRITAIGPAESTPVPGGAVVIDGHGKWVIPGLIDGHVHFFQSGNLYTRPDIADLAATVPYAMELARIKDRLPATFKVWLASGVTSVADVGGPFWNFDVRDAARASPAAPRVATTGPLISMVDRPKLDLGDPPIIKIASPAAARELVARLLKRKPDFVKVWFIHQPGDDLAAQEAIVKATADAAHAGGVRLAVHATELLTAKSALKVGADYLVHSVNDAPVDDEFLKLAHANHVVYCPTLVVGPDYFYALSGQWQPTAAEQRLADPQILASMGDLARIPKSQLPERVRKLVEDHKPVDAPKIAMQNLKTVWDAGITVAMGTDAGNIGTLHGPSVFREMQLMKESGLTPLQVLRSATVNGAAMLKRDDLGTIAPGKLADLVVLNADPLVDVNNLSSVYRTVKDGAVFDPDALIQSIR